MVERVLLIKGISGLGDRFLCVVTGVLYGRLSGRRVVVDWSDGAYSVGGINAFEHFFQSGGFGQPEGVPATESVAPAPWIGRIREPADALRSEYGAVNDAEGWRQFSIDLQRLDHPEQVAVMFTYGAELDSLLPHLEPPARPMDQRSRDTLLSDLMKSSLSVQPWIREEIDRFTRQRFRGRTVGVHVRYSDHRTALAATLRALRVVLDRDPACGIFLATDNREVERLFRRRYEHVVTTPRWYDATAGRPLHFGGRRPDPLRLGVEALVDLYLLAECDDLIIDTSSNFGYVAALLSRTDSARVVDVRKGDKLSPRIRHPINRLMRRSGFLTWGPRVIGVLVPR